MPALVGILLCAKQVKKKKKNSTIKYEKPKT